MFLGLPQLLSGSDSGDQFMHTVSRLCPSELSLRRGGREGAADRTSFKTLKGPHKMINCCQIGFFASCRAKQTTNRPFSHAEYGFSVSLKLKNKTQWVGPSGLH